MTRTVFAALVWCSMLGLAKPASALGGGSGAPVYLGVLGGYSLATDDPSIDPTGIALGLRGGLRLPMADIYLGGLVLCHLGESGDLLGAKVSASSFMLGVEGGYEFDFELLTLRPSLGLGVQLASVDVDANIIGLEAQDGSDVYLSPGVNAFVDVGVMLGAELRYNFILADNYPDSVSLLATLGIVL